MYEETSLYTSTDVCLILTPRTIESNNRRLEVGGGGEGMGKEEGVMEGLD